MHNENFCPFDIWAPDHRCSINNKAFSAFAYHQQNIENFIDALAASDTPNDKITQYAIADSVGLDVNLLTVDEIAYIEREVVRRC